MKLSIIIPAYNEEATIAAVIGRVAKLKYKKEIIVVNDGSTDKTRYKILDTRYKQIKLINKKINEGKGAAIRDALKVVTGDVVIIQDADLEYDPNDYKLLLKPILDGKAQVVFGSRFITSAPRRALYFWHWVGNAFLTLLTDAITNLNLTDMETCYKAFTAQVARKLDIKETRFGFEPEFTVKIAKMKVPVYEVGVSYSGRSYEEGKKIGWRDGVWAIWSLIKYGVLDI